MSAIVELRTAFKNAAISAGVIGSFRMGYISDFGSGQTDYPALLLIPPKDSVNTRMWNSRDFDIKYYIMKLDVGSGGAHMTDEERASAWGDLDAINKSIINTIMATHSSFQFITPVLTNYDSGGEDGLLPDKVIWIEVTLTLKVYDC